ncbi:hypothetical protein BDV34DRAFT_188129 [Aspergillus parasiticus]|uniref:Uncharacterized protein n=1 Tax=Aspergillus parasiticus TaxID=5067 RepID=A0A5N6DXL0_ASPPA|nr:hypothetical protein BDV34DRAFT_188129 [Aspergillus parasiticus]
MSQKHRDNSDPLDLRRQFLLEFCFFTRFPFSHETCDRRHPCLGYTVCSHYPRLDVSIHRRFRVICLGLLDVSIPTLLDWSSVR